MNEIFVGKHVIRMATIEDIPFIMDFLDKHWEKGCLLSRDRAYFEYEFVVDGRVNFVVASHVETGSIDATVGIIQCSKRSPFDGFGVMWVCKPKSGTKFLGFEINHYVVYISEARFISGVGVKSDTGAKLLTGNFSYSYVSKLNHYYRLAHCDNFLIAGIDQIRRAVDVPLQKKLICIPTIQHLRNWFDFKSLPDVPMYKDDWYIEHRYYNHPYYEFDVWGIEESPGNIIGLLVGRVIRCNCSAALRIVDFYGADSALEGIGEELDRIMESNNIEYTDFYCAGIPHEILQNAGFVLRDDDDKNIIPNHFEPYEKKNVDIFYACYTGEETHYFKGDGDQGRPRRLRLPSEWIIK